MPLFPCTLLLFYCHFSLYGFCFIAVFPSVLFVSLPFFFLWVLFHCHFPVCTFCFIAVFPYIDFVLLPFSLHECCFTAILAFYSHFSFIKGYNLFVLLFIASGLIFPSLFFEYRSNSFSLQGYI